MEEDTKRPAHGSLLMAEICEPMRRPLSVQQRKKLQEPEWSEAKLHFAFHNWSRQGHVTSLSHGPPRTGERETLRLIGTRNTQKFWRDGRSVTRKMTIRRGRGGDDRDHATTASKRGSVSDSKSNIKSTEESCSKDGAHGVSWGIERGDGWMKNNMSGWRPNSGGWIPSVGEKTPPPGYFTYKVQSTATQRPLGAVAAFAAPESDRNRRPHSAMAAMAESSGDEDGAKGMSPRKRDTAGRRSSAEKRHTAMQQAHAREAVCGHVPVADFRKFQTHLDPAVHGKKRLWEPDDPVDLRPVSVQEHVVDQTFRPCRHEGSQVYGPNRGGGDPEDRAGWLSSAQPRGSHSNNLGMSHEPTEDLKGIIDFNHSLGHQSMLHADSAFGNLHVARPVDVEKPQITGPRVHGDEQPLRPRACTPNFRPAPGRDETVNVRAVDESGRVVVVEATKAIGRNMEPSPITECEAFSHLLAMQSEVASSFKKCGQPQSKAKKFRSLRKCVVR